MVGLSEFTKDLVKEYHEALMALPHKEIVWLGSEDLDISDIAAIQELYESANSYFCRIAKLEGRIVGDVNLFINGEEEAAEINILVLPEYRGRGIAKMLLDEAIRESRLRGIYSIIAKIDADNCKAIEFFLKHAFAEYRMERNVFGQVELRLLLPGQGQDDEL